VIDRANDYGQLATAAESLRELNDYGIIATVAENSGKAEP